jgi:phage terminase large subunit
MTARRVVVPDLTLLAHQQEAIEAWRAGARRMIWLWHRQAGKGLTALSMVAMAAWEKPATYMIASPTAALSRENHWDAINPDTGRRYLDIIPPELIIDCNQNELALVMRTKVPDQVSRIVFRPGGEDADRLRGPAYGGVVLDEYATYSCGAEALDVVRIPVERAGGFLLVSSTPKGLNHLHALWKNAESAGGWYLSRKTIEETRNHAGEPIIPLAQVEQERREGQREEWLQQEYYASFTAALQEAYYADQLTKAEAEGRIGDVPYRSDRPVLVSFDLGVYDATVVIYVQPVGDMFHIIDCDEYRGLALPEIISRTRAKGYVIDPRGWYAPHDLATAGRAMSRVDVARQLGVQFQVVPRVSSVQENIDAVRRIFNRFRFDRRRNAKLLEMLGNYQREWNHRTKSYEAKPAHREASHYADALACFARGYRAPSDRTRGYVYARTATSPHDDWSARYARSRTAEW